MNSGGTTDVKAQGRLRQAKIVCTIGPASSSPGMVRELMLAGMDVARLNFSHGSHDSHARVIVTLREIAADLGRTICVLQDLQGPKIRTGALKNHEPIPLLEGQEITIVGDDITGTRDVLGTTYRDIASDVMPGERVLLSDGKMELIVRDIQQGKVICQVVYGGMLGERQGINLPGTNVSIPSLTEKDEADLEFGLKSGVDVVALSFVRTAEDIARVQCKMAELGREVPIIAKLEKPQAIENLDAILMSASGVMVARGDLGVELAPEKVPVIQKQVIRRASFFRRPVITATQMLESMTSSPRPTRAEANDVANAILDGTDAVMLSGETAAGKYPRETVEMMSRIVVEAEAFRLREPIPERHPTEQLSLGETICEAMAHAADDLDIRAIAVFTESGTSARMLSKHRPNARIYAFTASEAVCNRVNLLWGVTPMRCPASVSVEQMAAFAEDELIRCGALTGGEIFGLIAGTTHIAGGTNFLRLIKAGAS
jgi:pyruvate kinase